MADYEKMTVSESEMITLLYKWSMEDNRGDYECFVLRTAAGMLHANKLMYDRLCASVMREESGLDKLARAYREEFGDGQ